MFLTEYPPKTKHEDGKNHIQPDISDDTEMYVFILKLVLCYKFLLIYTSTSSSKCILASFFSNWFQFVELLILGSLFFLWNCYMQEINHTKSNWVDEGNLGREPDSFTGSICDSVDRRYEIRRGSKRYKFIMNGWNIKMNLLWHVMIMKCYFRHCIILLGGRILDLKIDQYQSYFLSRLYTHHYQNIHMDDTWSYWCFDKRG